MIKLKTLLNENDMLKNDTKEGYVIQQGHIGYEDWIDATGLHEDKNYAIKAYRGWRQVLASRPKGDIERIRLIKRTIITKEEILDV